VVERIGGKRADPERRRAAVERLGQLREAGELTAAHVRLAASGKGMLRNWAVFTHAAVGLCGKAGIGRIIAEVAGNVYAKLGGGIS
jgi:hypothetical protein